MELPKDSVVPPFGSYNGPKTLLHSSGPWLLTHDRFPCATSCLITITDTPTALLRISSLLTETFHSFWSCLVLLTLCTAPGVKMSYKRWNVFNNSIGLPWAANWERCLKRTPQWHKYTEHRYDLQLLALRIYTDVTGRFHNLKPCTRSSVTDCFFYQELIRNSSMWCIFHFQWIFFYTLAYYVSNYHPYHASCKSFSLSMSE